MVAVACRACLRALARRLRFFHSSHQYGRGSLLIPVFVQWQDAMNFTTRLLGIGCAVLTLLLWAITLWTDPAPGAIVTAAALTIVTAIAGVLTVLS
jgi:hypothetical protein